MVIVWGSRLMGKVDVVPGLFHVATKFGHLYYLPLIPSASYIVLSQDDKAFRGIPISLSMKSILFAWLRAGLFLAAMIASVAVLVVSLDKKQGQWLGPSLIAAALWLVFALTWHKSMSRASFTRACAMAEKVGLTEEGVKMIQLAYGQPMPRGFTVAPKRVMPAANATMAGRAQVARRPAVDDGPIPLEP